MMKDQQITVTVAQSYFSSVASQSTNTSNRYTFSRAYESLIRLLIKPRDECDRF